MLLDEYHNAILKALFFEPATMYQLEKTTLMKHATCHKKVQELLKAGLIMVEKEEPFKTGLPKRQFKLSREGYLETLKILNYNDRRVQSRLSELASQNPPIHPALPLWPIVLKITKGKADFMFKLLLEDVERNFPIFMSMLLQQNSTAFPIAQLKITIKPVKLLSDEEQKILVEEIKKREDLYRILMENLEARIKEHEIMAENLRKVKELLL